MALVAIHTRANRELWILVDDMGRAFGLEPWLVMDALRRTRTGVRVHARLWS